MKTKCLAKYRYHNHENFSEEAQKLFAEKVEYLGPHSLLKTGPTATPLDRLDNEWLLINKDDNLKLLKNRCCHRNAKLLIGPSSSNKWTCKMHGWSYNDNGQCISTPLMQTNEPTPPLRLEAKTVSTWGDMSFATPQFDTFQSKLLDFKPFQFAAPQSKIYHKSYNSSHSYNWKYYVELFEENYHVPFVHPGFSKFVDLKSLEWHEDPRFTAQIFRFNKDIGNKLYSTKSDKYDRWIQLLSKHYNGHWPEFACVLINFYPNLIFEIFPLCMTVTTIHPTSANQFTIRTDYYHDAQVIKSNPSLCEAAEEALEETESEDALNSERLIDNKSDGTEADRNDPVRILHPHLEYGLNCFYRYYRKNMLIE